MIARSKRFPSLPKEGFGLILRHLDLVAVFTFIMIASTASALADLTDHLTLRGGHRK